MNLLTGPTSAQPQWKITLHFYRLSDCQDWQRHIGWGLTNPHFMPLIPPNPGHQRDQTLNISPCSSCCMLGHFHTCPWLLVSRVPHPAGSPRLFVIQITRVCHSLLYGTLGWGGGGAERDAGIKVGIREMGLVKERERVEKGKGAEGNELKEV